MKKLLLLLVTHGLVGAIGFAAGIYVLPILTAPDAPAAADTAVCARQAWERTPGSSSWHRRTNFDSIPTAEKTLGWRLE